MSEWRARAEAITDVALIEKVQEIPVAEDTERNPLFCGEDGWPCCPAHEQIATLVNDRGWANGQHRNALVRVEAERDALAAAWLTVCREGNVPQYEAAVTASPDGILHGVRQLAAISAGYLRGQEHAQGRVEALEAERTEATDLLWTALTWAYVGPVPGTELRHAVDGAVRKIADLQEQVHETRIQLHAADEGLERWARMVGWTPDQGLKPLQEHFVEDLNRTRALVHLLGTTIRKAVTGRPRWGLLRRAARQYRAWRSAHA